jgi:uncharacterized protein
MRILIYLHHPAHFHLFKNVIDALNKKHEVIILATKKDILENLLQNANIPYINVLPYGRKDNKFSIALAVLKQDWRLIKICINKKPDILVGTSTEITHVGKLLNIPSIFVNEDDVEAIPLVGKIAYPFARHILVPNVCSTGKWEKKTIRYSSYHELSYLHPDNFNPEKTIANKYVVTSKPYFIIRFAKLMAHHDRGVSGISTSVAMQIIAVLKDCGNIYITSERELEKEFEQYRIEINPNEIHHVMAFASLYIGDSQTMAAEAGVLGTPFIRFNDFVGRIGYLRELEDHYKLGFGIRPDQPEQLMAKITELLSMEDLSAKFEQRRQKMLNEKINLADFMTWLIEMYPESVKILKSNPDYQYNFK